MTLGSTDPRRLLPRRLITLETSTAKAYSLVGAIAVAARVLSLVRQRGYWDFCKWAGRCFRDDEFVHVHLADDAVFRIRLSDPYWNRLIGFPYEYEPEIAFLLARLKRTDYNFIDCGANQGYWSVLVTSSTFGCKWSIAIEPFSDSFHMLEVNNALNGSRFATLARAVGEVSDVEVALRYLGNHAEVGTASAEDAAESSAAFEETVSTISLDDVFEHHVPDKSKPLVIKIDVEGAEISALAGAQRVRSRDPLIVFEDHGRDPECVVARFVLDNLAMDVFHIDDADRIAQMRTIEDVRNVKRSKRRGYNFIAVGGDSRFKPFLQA